MNQKYYIIGLFFMASTIIADCFICNKPIQEDEEHWQDGNTKWHESCFLCSNCNQLINENDEKFIFPNKNLYHSVCPDGTDFY